VHYTALFEKIPATYELFWMGFTKGGEIEIEEYLHSIPNATF